MPAATNHIPLPCLLAACLSAVPLARGASVPADQLQFFEQKIRPVLVEHCYECHSARAEKLKGGLLLDSKSGWQAGGDSGDPIIVPGKPGESLLLRVLRHEVEDLKMPPKQARLPDRVIADFTTWIRAGAADPREATVTQPRRADKSWWSLQPLADAAIPSPKGLPGAWSRNPIDRYIFAKLAGLGLQPNPPADARTLIRRMTYDLTGLPPTPGEVESFIADHRADAHRAVETLVDRLLASPHYGERWGRHWLDVVRFGESNGFERNFLITDLWPFRDYVIRSLNEDKPFNRFIVEHLAGDVVGKDDPDVEVASAFLVAGPYDDVGNQDPVAAANIRANTLDEIISTTGAAFLGLTINCAKCHDHKFDPVPTEDYYRMRAAFEGVHHGRRVVATAEQRGAHAAATRPLEERKSALTAEKAALEKEIEAAAREELKRRTFAREKARPELTGEKFPPVEARHVKLVMLADTGNPRGLSSPRLDELEVWTAGDRSRNVALASNGATVAGNTARQADDFAGAYGVELVNDGRFGARWFAAAPHELTVTFPRPERIDRITFSHTRGSSVLRGLGEFPCEYEIRVSLDGQDWRTVATSEDREPWSEAHGVERIRRSIVTGEQKQQLAALNRQLADVQRELNAIPPLPQAWVGTRSQPKERTVVFKGGDPTKPGEPVLPASLQVLGQVTTPYALEPDVAEAERRLALARWIVREDNPLTARVLANRVWHYHFGTGIVDTPSDFGFLGGQPTHPGLLDWLARRLRAHGWRLKPLHREILLSQTYLQSGAFREDAARVDGDARLLWRFPPRRLSAEEIRDTMLTVAGKLDLRMGGPGFQLYRYMSDNVSTYFPLDEVGPGTYRRAIYHQNARASVVDVLSDFDLPDNAFAAPKRANTTTPLQALTLLNHRFTLDMAAAFARRIEKESDTGTTPVRVERAYAIAIQRPPRPAERDAAVQLIEAHGLDAFCRALLNANELIHLE
jgi:mono/diheme cytochrome c family protein